MNWDDLKLILAVTRTGGAAAASHSLGVSHATVSRRIADLERGLGLALVDRSGLGWRVTPMCERLAVQAEAMEASHLEAKRLASAFSSDMSGPVRISVPTGTVASFCARALQDLPKAAPDIQLVFHTDDSFADLPGRKSDLAVRFTKSPDPNLIGERAAVSHWAFYSDEQWAPKISKQLSHGDPIYAPLLTDSAEGKRPSWANNTFAQNCPCHYAYGFIDKAALSANGFGIAMLPRIVGDDFVGLHSLKHLECTLTTDLWVLANSDTRSSKRISLVKKHLIKGLRMRFPALTPG